MYDVTMVMPYWRRSEVLLSTLESIEEQYGASGLLKVIVVDDGSHDVCPPKYSWLEFIQLPKKDVVKNPCVPLNIGLKEVKTKFTCITNPETCTLDPILFDLVELANDLPEDAYLLPGVYCSGQKKWLQHHLYENAGLHFYSFCRTSLIEKVNFFDEVYRDGASWEDNDFVRKLETTGTQFINCDHLVAFHQRNKQNNPYWPSDLKQINLNIYKKKWAGKIPLLPNGYPQALYINSQKLEVK